MLFNFFKENGITSDLKQINDYDDLMKRILESEFISFNFNPSIENYGIDFKLSQRIEEAEVYMFNFGKSENTKSSSILFDFGEREFTSFLTFSWYEEKLPPFIKDFLNEESKIILSDDDENLMEPDLFWTETMSLDQFKLFLTENCKQKHVTWVAVD